MRGRHAGAGSMGGAGSAAAVRGWSFGPSRTSLEEGLAAGGGSRAVALWGRPAVPFFSALWGLSAR